MKVHKIPVNDLRLYCLRVKDSVVVLFNGGIKTRKNAKDCPNVGPHIRQANRITQKINQLFVDKEISWNKDKTDIVFLPDLEFEL